MAGRQTTANMSLYTLGGTSYLGLFRNTSMRFDVDEVEASPANQLGMRPQAVKQGMTLQTELMSVVSGSVKVQHTDLSAITVDGTDYLAAITGTFSGEFTTQEGDGAGAFWKYPIVTKKGYRFSGQIRVPSATGGAQALLADAVSGTHTDKSMVLSFTINGITVTLPMMLKSAELAFEDGGLQTIAIELVGQAGDGATYPTAPTGTTSLLEKALNAPQTALAMALTTHATEGMAYSGNVIFTAFSIAIEDGALINTQYTFASQGAITGSAN